MLQLELFERETLSASELVQVVAEMRNLYWHIRNTRRGMNDARRRRVYRKIAVQKKRLLVAGVSKREVLDLLACCRSKQCRAKGCLGCVDDTAKHRHNI